MWLALAIATTPVAVNTPALDNGDHSRSTSNGSVVVLELANKTVSTTLIALIVFAIVRVVVIVIAIDIVQVIFAALVIPIQIAVPFVLSIAVA